MDPGEDVATGQLAADETAKASVAPPEPSVLDKDVDLGCGGCTHWLSADLDAPDESE